MLESILDNNFIASILAFAIILIPAVIIHELGHFFAAKMVGINVLEFGIGFPPRAMRLFMWGETEFTLNWLPIGGFVRPLGEDMVGPVIDDDDEYDGDKPKNTAYINEREELIARGVPEDKLMSVNEASPTSRLFFMAAGAIANVISAMIFFAVAALIGLPQFVGARVTLEAISPDSVFAQAGVEAGDAIEQINGAYFTDHLHLFEILFDDLAGETATLQMRSLETEDPYEVSITPPAATTRGEIFITAVVEGSPGEAAGLQIEDTVIAIDGEALSVENPILDVLEATEERAGQAIALTIDRAGQIFDVQLTPRVDPPTNEGRIGIGIAAIFASSDGVRWANANPQQEIIPRSFSESIQYSLSRTYEVFELIVTLPAQLIDGTISPEEARPVSIVGISQIGGQFLQQSARQGTPTLVLEFIALISIFLGITNLLPFPPLDGGRILFVLIEMVRGKPVSPQIENTVYRIGIALLLALGLFIIVYDIFNPIQLPT